MRELISEYYELMQTMDSSFHWSNEDWWMDAENARVVSVADGQGFAIVGYGRYADDDVASEICELYCKNPWSLLPLMRRCFPYIRWPLGFQVLVANFSAQNAFERMLRLFKCPYTKTMASDGGSQVYKYRIAGEGVSLNALKRQ